MTRPSKRSSAKDTKARISEVAIGLLIRHGLRGMSYDMIAKKLEITTTNIHYHFGSKDRLVHSVVEQYVGEASAKHSSIWRADGLTLQEKIQAAREFNRRRHARFNSPTSGGQPWSLIARMRLEGDAVPSDTQHFLQDFANGLRDDIHFAVYRAKESGELRTEVPEADVAKLLTGIVYGSAVFTQMTGSFDGMEEIYDAFWAVVAGKS